MWLLKFHGVGDGEAVKRKMSEMAISGNAGGKKC